MRDGRLRYPDGKRFAFTVFDDCDNASVAKTRPVYELLERLGMRTTMTVWALGSDAVHPNWAGSSTLEDPEYRSFAVELGARGFEIAFHGASMMSSPRERTERALEVFRETFGRYPRSHANHGANRENLYWASARFRSRVLRALYAWRAGEDGPRSEGHLAGSPYFWGDLCQKHIEYVRGFTFPVLDLRAAHRHVLYADPATPFVNFWFSAAHAPNVAAFNALIHPSRVARLARDGGVAIVATHLAAGVAADGEVHPVTRQRLEAIAELGGWCVPVATLLDHLRQGGLGRPVPAAERRWIELRWLLHAMGRGVGR